MSALRECLEGGTQCQINTLPPVCVDELGLSDGEGFGSTSGTLYRHSPRWTLFWFPHADNHSEARPVNSRTTLQMLFGHESHERGNFTAYDNVIRQAWLVVTGFAERGRDDNHPRGSAGQPAIVACIQANEIEQRSRTFDNAADAALLSRMRIWASVMVTVALIF